MTGRAITLSRGRLRFSAWTAGEGPLVLLLHGFPDTPQTFAAQMQALADAGYCAVAATMRGYEPGSQPDDGDYHAIRMAEDVVAWIVQLGKGPAHLVGHDWGANIAYAVAAMAPQALRSLTTLAVPHPLRFAEAYATDAAQQARSHYILDFLAPGFEDRIVADGCAYLAALWHAWSPGWAIPPEALANVRAVFAKPGVARAALEYYRQALDGAAPASLATQTLFATPIQVPTMAICGDEDGCIAADVFVGAMREADFPARLRVERVTGAGHFVHAEAAQAVNQRLIDWFST